MLHTGTVGVEMMLCKDYGRLRYFRCREEESGLSKKKKYVKEAWPGRKPGAL